MRLTFKREVYENLLTLTKFGNPGGKDHAYREIFKDRAQTGAYVSRSFLLRLREKNRDSPGPDLTSPPTRKDPRST